MPKAPLPHPRHEDTLPLPTVSEEAARARDAALIAPLPSAEPEEDEERGGEPDAVLPQAPQSRPGRQDSRTARNNVIRPGDLICGSCGQGNAPARRFCARCGFELREAQVARTPWWRRLLRRRRGPRVVELGTGSGLQDDPAPAPGGRLAAFWVRLKAVLGIVFCLSAMLYVSYAPFRSMVNDRASEVRRTATGFIESQYSPVRPAKVTGPSAKARGTENLIDLNTASYWSVPYTAKDAQGKGKTVLIVEFDRLVNLNQLIVTPGAGDEFTQHGRPRQMILTFTNEKQSRVELQDSAEPQKFSLNDGLATRKVTIEFTDVYPSAKGEDVAVAELEFFSLLS
ncbi:NADase-type glycan-binding domain-containing protein [Streptomyces cyaneofuscatus]|uniref:NADase-type glycan-binding domain-containing protein n=1 Tax=Streptomyces cyaneofuscatus TaxID=66883 RepID=UPI00341E25CE